MTKAVAAKALGLSATAFNAAAARLARQGRLAHPKRGFFLILRPEDRAAGGPDPARWIDPLMHYLGLDYRISLLRAAAFHGSSHQAAQVFQVI
ncbi:MAG: type IV toxin-antitoxin system AbiEi family antitoxin, partial [Acidobacteriota bacterium]|nr:type IV toxin-antitoxin system AbiEi family antitoxin [Acidobacteriota bacterium]